MGAKPGAVTDIVLSAATEPSVQKPGLATPEAFVFTRAVETLPPPPVTENATVRSAIGLPVASRAVTAGAAGKRNPAIPAWLLPAVTTSANPDDVGVEGVDAVAFALKFAGA